MATIKDIAAAVGVSPTTVSNVLHGKSQRVSAETISRINQAIAQLGYVPNMAARAMAGRQSKIIGVISNLVPLSSGGFFQDPFHSVLLSGIEQTLRANGYFLMVRTVETAEEMNSLLANWNIDGLIMTGAFPPEIYRSLREQMKPFVLIDSACPEEGSLQIQLEDFQGGYIATKHLLEQGHRDILFCCPKMEEAGVVRQRYNGYCKALTEYGVNVRPELICESSFSIEEGIAAGRALALRNDFTALFATADILAVELSTGLTLAGRRIPEDVSIVGFDDARVASMNCPPLTTVRQDVVGRGAKAVEMLLHAIETGAHSAPYVFPVELVQRESTRRIV